MKEVFRETRNKGLSLIKAWIGELQYYKLRTKELQNWLRKQTKYQRHQQRNHTCISSQSVICNIMQNLLYLRDLSVELFTST